MVPTTEDGYDRSSIPLCKCCGGSEHTETTKNGQVIARCADCDTWLKNLPKLREGRRGDSSKLKKAKIAQMGSSFCAVCLRTEEFLEQQTGLGISVHHIIEVRHRGSDEMHNLLLLCHECHEITHRLREMLYPRHFHNNVKDKYR